MALVEQICVINSSSSLAETDPEKKLRKIITSKINFILFSPDKLKFNPRNEVIGCFQVQSLVSFISFNFYTTESHRGNNRKKPLLYGIWEASYFIKNGDTLQPLTTDDFRWRYLIVDLKDEATVKTMDDLKHQYKFITDSTSQKIMIHKKYSETEDYNFNYKNPNSEFLQLDGIIESDTLRIILFRKDHKKFNLNSRGFNWINERPYNR